MVSLQLLGGASVSDQNGPLHGPAAYRKRIALLALLALAPERRVSRDKLLAYLWPESPTGRARHQLSSALHDIRRALGEHVIGAVGDELWLDATALRVDAVELETALAAGELERAAGLYRGALLDGFHLSGAAAFESWVDRERARLAGGYARAVQQLAEAAESRRDFAAAVHWWTAGSAHDPYDSRIAARVVQALAAAGNPAGALQHAEAHRQLLLQELGIEPSAELTTRVARVRAARVPPSAAAHVLPSADGATTGTAPPPVREAAPLPLPPAPPHAPAVVPPPSPGGGAAWLPPRRARTLWLSLTMAAATLAAVGYVAIGRPEPTPGEIRRVAVLPLAAHAHDGSQDYFVAGLHDALVAELSQIGGLTVLSRQAVLRFAQSDRPLASVARELGADALVEGAALLVGDSVRIMLQVLRAEPEQRLATIVRHGAVEDALALQGDVARELARSLRAGIAPGVEARFARRHASSSEAQQAYLRGLYELERATFAQAVDLDERRAAHRAAVDYLQRAAALDPDWAAAHARLSYAYLWLAAISTRADGVTLFARARAAALRALELDEGEAQAHVSHALVLYWQDRDWTGAERAFRRAIALDPNSHHWEYARFLQAAGRHDDALAHYRAAEERNPLSHVLKWNVAQAYDCAGRHAEAIAKAEELEAHMAGADGADREGYATGIGTRPFIAFALTWKGMNDSAIAVMEANVVQLDSVAAALIGLAYVYARAGRHAEARALTARLEAQTRARGGQFLPAQIFAALGDTERALDMVEASLASEPTMLPIMRCSQTWRLLQHEPRMQEMARRVGMPPGPRLP